MLRTSSGLIMYSGSVSEEANFEGTPGPDKLFELEPVVEEVCAARDEQETDTSRQAAARLLPRSFLWGSHFTPAETIISVLLVALPQGNSVVLATRDVRRQAHHQA